MINNNQEHNQYHNQDHNQDNQNMNDQQDTSNTPPLNDITGNINTGNTTSNDINTGTIPTPDSTNEDDTNGNGTSNEVPGSQSSEVSANELDELFGGPRLSKEEKQRIKEEKGKAALCSPSYKGPRSYVEAKELINKYRGKEWHEIPPEARYCYVTLNAAVSRKPGPTGTTGLGYNPDIRNINKGVRTPGGSTLSITRTAIEWGGMFVTVRDEVTGALKNVRIPDDVENIPISVTIFLPPEGIEMIEKIMEDNHTQVVNIPVIADAVVTIQPLNQLSRQQQYHELMRLSTDNTGSNNTGNTGGDSDGDTKDVNKFMSVGPTLANPFVDIEGVVPAAQINLSLEETDPNKLLALMTSTTVGGFRAAREIRTEQVKHDESNINKQQPAPSALEQMDSVVDTQTINI